MTRVRITPAIIKWAQQRAGVDDEQLARKMGLSERPETINAWLSGEDRPTLRQAQDLAKHLRIPFGYLFLSQPPTITLPVTDFRSVPDSERGSFSPDLQEVLFDALRKRDWMRERRISEDLKPLSFVGRFTARSGIIETAADIRRVLGLPEPGNLGVSGSEKYLRLLVRQTEAAGILVLQNGIVATNTSRPLDIREFRGFVLSDEFAPVIFINSKDWYAARIFTLAHELAHLWIGDSGISNPEADPEQFIGGPDREKICNQIAAEVLVPASLLTRYWTTYSSPYTTAKNLIRTFLVSTFVILIRAYDLQLISYTDLQAAIHTASDQIPAQPSRQKSGGPGLLRSVATRNSRLFVRELTSAVLEGAVQHHEAARLLNIHHRHINQVIQQWQ